MQTLQRFEDRTKATYLQLLEPYFDALDNLREERREVMQKCTDLCERQTQDWFSRASGGVSPDEFQVELGRYASFCHLIYGQSDRQTEVLEQLRVSASD